MQFTYTKRYLHRFDRFPADDQHLILAADSQVRAYYATRQAPHGLRIKLLHSGTAKVLEARASQAIRIVWVETDDVVSFALVGLHDEVRNYLRSLH